MHSARSYTCQLRSRAMASLVSAILNFLVMGLAALTTLTLAGASQSAVTTHTLQSQRASPTKWSQGQQGQVQQVQGQQSQGQQSYESPAVEATSSGLSSAFLLTETPSTPSPPCPPTKYHREGAWNGSIAWDFHVELCTPVTSWAIAGPDSSVLDRYHFVVEIHFVEMEKSDSLEVFIIDANNTRLRTDYKSSNGTAVSPILVPSKKILIEVKTPDEDHGFRERRQSRFNLTYTVIPWYELLYIKPTETKTLYRCNGIANLPKAITCDRISHCERREDEESCSYSSQGCGTWFPFRDKCFQAIFERINKHKRIFGASLGSYQNAEEACHLHGATLATLQEPGAITMAAGLIRKKGFESAFVGLRKVRPVTRRLSYLYRFLWQWGPQGGPIAYEQQQLQRDGATEGCAVLNVSVKPVLEQAPCSDNVKIFYGYICMKPHQTFSTESSSPSSVSLARATQFPSSFPVKECPEGSYVQLFHRCHWGKEEQTQHDEGWSPNKLPLFKCRYGQTVHYTLLCDGKDDCADGSDEMDCRRPRFAPLLNTSFVCNNFQAIPAWQRCDGVFDCFDESDEEYCTSCDDSIIRERTVICSGFGCLPTYYGHYSFMCRGYNGFFNPIFIFKGPRLWPYDSGNPGEVILDGYGMSRIDTGDGNHTEGVDGNCSEGLFPCVDSYCIPTFLVNNGEKDCPRGEDEDASLTVTCPGYYRCQELGTCVHDTHLCDGIYHCPNKDDEMFCKNIVSNYYQDCEGQPGYYRCETNNTCVHNSYLCDGTDDCHFKDDEYRCRVICPRAHGCECEGHAYTCSSMIDPLQNLHVRYLDVSHARNVSLQNIHFMEYLFFLNLSFCGLDNVILADMPQLQILDLKNNYLTQLDSLGLYQLHGLRYLDLSNNPLLTAADNAFNKMLNLGGLHSLKTLIMINVGLETITTKGFSVLSNLVHLDIRMNAVHIYTEDSLTGLTALEELYTDETNLCCSYFHASLSRCHAPVDELSSCSDLLGQDFFRVCLWSMSAMALLGNAGVLIYRLVCKQTTAPSSQILVKTLCASDLLMGVYMMMIGVADAQFRGVYVAKENEWKNSVACTMAGFLSFVSSQVSAFVVCLITLDRVLVICFPFNKRVHLSYRSAIFACSVVCFGGIFLAALPIIAGIEFYGQNGICIPLPITRQQFSGQSYAFGVFIVLNFVVFIFIGLGQAFICQAIYSSRKAAGSQQREQDVAVARRLFLIVLTDFCCWFPIGLMGLLAASGTPIPGEVNVWTAIFVLPLNSALNPFLYTLNSLVEKREKGKMEKKAEKLMGKLQTEIPKLSSSRAAELVRIVVQSRLVEREVLLKIMGANVDTTADTLSE